MRGVAGAAVFGTLTAIDAWLIGNEPQNVVMARNGIDLSGQPRGPEGMNHIRRTDAQIDGPACREVQNALDLDDVLGTGPGMSERPVVLIGLGRNPDHIRGWQWNGPQPHEEGIDHEGRQNCTGHAQPKADDPEPCAARTGLGSSTESQNEGYEDDSAEQGRPGQHHPPELGDRCRSKACGVENRQISGASGQTQDADRHQTALHQPADPGKNRFMTSLPEDSAEKRLVDPIAEDPSFHRTGSKVAVAGHPIHAMLVAFPVALCACTFGADLLYWYTGDLFWARAGLWAAGMGFLMGVLAGVAGTVELLWAPGIRARAASWTHFVIAVMLLSLLGANWGLRLMGFEAAVLPFGVLLSAFALGFTGFTGWHGGKLVFEYQIGVSSKGS